jgi:hypothetical protein
MMSKASDVGGQITNPKAAGRLAMADHLDSAAKRMPSRANELSRRASVLRMAATNAGSETVVTLKTDGGPAKR